MSTGYDSFWMYQNNRLEPVLNLPKNDNYSHAVLTDSYKQVQNGGQPSHLNSYLPPQNNTQSSYQYNQPRTGGSQYVWQSSVYSMPLKASYMNSFHAQEAFSIHSNNIRHSFEYSHAQQNVNDYRYLKNVNASVTQLCSNNDNSQNNCSNSALIKDNHNINKETARIRVKDVFSLNNNITSKQGQNTSLYQATQKEQPQCALNYGTINHNTTYTSKTQSYFNYGEGNLQQPNHPPPYYRSAVTGHDQQFPQISNQFYPQNAERQPQFRTNIPTRERNFNMEPSQARVDQSILKNILNVGNNQDSNVQNINNSSESLQGSNGVKSTPRSSVQIDNSGMINTSGYGDMLGVVPKNCNQNNVTQFQNRRSVIEDTCLSKSKPATTPVSNVPTSVNAKSPAHQLSGRQDTTVIRISIPHSSQDTFVALTDCNSTNESLSLPCLLESNEQFFSGWITQSNNNTKENSGINISESLTSETGVTNASEQSGNFKPPQTSHNAESPFQKTLTVPPRKRFCQVKDPLIGLNKENLDEFINSTPENTSGKLSSKMTMEKCIARETNFQQDITLNAMTLKQENFNKGEESPAPEQNISESRVSLEMIKTEEPPPEDENPEYSTIYGQCREGSNILDEQFSSVVDITESIELSKTEIQKLVLASEIPEASAKDSENSYDKREAENSNNKSDGKRRNSSAKKRVEERKIDAPSIKNVIKNYKSKINRDKLDMLIQFLEKDDLPSETKSESSVEKKTDNNNQKRQEVDVNHNRRKLNKTCVVKNKNNSREMVSMISHKNARVEVKSASQTAQTVKPANSTEDGSIINESGSGTEKHGKSNPTSDSGTLAEYPPRSKHTRESSREPSSEDNSVPEEQQNVIQTIRALQNLKTVFCRKCNLTLTLDQFWINLVSGELKCLNCFKEMTLKDEENTPESKANDVSKSESKGAQYDSVTNTRDWSNGNNLKDTNRLKGSPQNGSKNPKETIKHEVMESPKKIKMANNDDGEKRQAHEHSRKEIIESVSTEQKKVRKEILPDKKNNLKAESSHKRKYSEDGSKPEMRRGKEGSSIPKDIISGENGKMDKPVDQSIRRSTSKERYSTGKSEKSIRKRSTSKEEEISDHSKREEKGMNHSNQIRKRNESRDSSHKEHSKKEVKSEKLIKKSRESHTSNKDNIAEQTAKKAAKYEHSEPKIQTPSKESYSYQKPKTSEQVKPVKEFSALEESIAKSTSSPNSLEKPKKVESTWQPLKRKHSDENADAVKVRIVEDGTKRDVKVLVHRTSVTEEDTAKHKNKIPDRDTQPIKTDKFRRSSSSKEEEQSKKETNGSFDSAKRDMIHHKSKTQEHEKQKADDTVARKIKEHGVLKRHEQSKSEEKRSKTVDTSDLQRRKSTSKDEAGSPISHAENKDRKKTEEREKNSSGKTAKSVSSERDEHSGNSVTASRQLKENQNTKMGKTGSLKSKTIDLHEQKRERKKNTEEGKDEKKHYKRIKEKEKAVDDEKKCSDHSERMRQTENKHGRGFDEACSGEKKEGEGGIDRKHSTSLLAKLMKKTKKLSWSLLDEA